MKKVIGYFILAALSLGVFFIYDRTTKYNAYLEAEHKKSVAQAKEMREVNKKLAEKLIPYKVINKDINDKLNKLTLNIEVNIVGKRLPNAKEIGDISKYLVRIEERHYTNAWVNFFLPGMKVNAGAYATAHHTPNMKAEILGYMLQNYPEYKKYMK